MDGNPFTLLSSTPTENGFAARRGVLRTAHGEVQTPVFMPVGTQATVKTLEPRDLRELKVQILLGNTYHLLLRPGNDIMALAGGLHAFMGWDGPILTDSGGFQVFSLGKLRKITPAGVAFNSHIDGRRFLLGPKESMETQRILGSDVAMCFDECIPYPATRDYAEKSVRTTIEWAARCKEEPHAPGQLVFGIVQGAAFPDLRALCARELASIGFDGYAVGGVSVGEPEDVLLRGIEDGAFALPEDAPRYLMGVGDPIQLVEGVARGIDMFDCVMPTRHARNGSAFTRHGSVPIKAGRFARDLSPVERPTSATSCTAARSSASASSPSTTSTSSCASWSRCAPPSTRAPFPPSAPAPGPTSAGSRSPDKILLDTTPALRVFFASSRKIVS